MNHVRFLHAHPNVSRWASLYRGRPTPQKSSCFCRRPILSFWKFPSGLGRLRSEPAREPLGNNYPGGSTFLGLVGLGVKLNMMEQILSSHFLPKMSHGLTLKIDKRSVEDNLPQDLCIGITISDQTDRGSWHV